MGFTPHPCYTATGKFVQERDSILVPGELHLSFLRLSVAICEVTIKFLWNRL